LNPDLSTILSLKRVLESAGEGMGMAQSLVRELRNVEPLGTETARLLLLGFPLQVALGHFTRTKSEEVAMLASLMLSAPRSSSALVGMSGSVFAGTLERWVKARESSELEQKVMRFRSIITSAVLGAVSAMIASLGPLMGILALAGNQPPANSITLQYAAAAFTGVSSGMLGLFMSGRGFYVNIVVSMALFAFVSALASPLAAFSSTSLWGVK